MNHLLPGNMLLFWTHQPTDDTWSTTRTSSFKPLLYFPH